MHSSVHQIDQILPYAFYPRFPLHPFEAKVKLIELSDNLALTNYWVCGWG